MVSSVSLDIKNLSSQENEGLDTGLKEVYREEIITLIDRILYGIATDYVLALDGLNNVLSSLIKAHIKWTTVYLRSDRILERLDTQVLKEQDKDVYLCAKKLVAMAEILYNANFKSENTNKWLKLKVDHRFRL